MTHRGWLWSICAIAMFSAVANADPLTTMDEALKKIPPRAVQVLEIAAKADDISKGTFDQTVEAKFRKLYSQVTETDKDIGVEVAKIDALSGEINKLHQETAAKKGEEQTQMASLNSQLAKVNSDLATTGQHLAKLDQDLANADREVRESEERLRREDEKQKRLRRKWWSPVAWIKRLIEGLKKKHRKLRNNRNDIATARNRVFESRQNTLNQQNQFQGQLSTLTQSISQKDTLLARINHLLNMGNNSKQQMVNMHLYLNRLQPHMEGIQKNLQTLEKVAEKTPGTYSEILKNSLEALRKFNVDNTAYCNELRQLAPK